MLKSMVAAVGNIIDTVWVSIKKESLNEETVDLYKFNFIQFHHKKSVIYGMKHGFIFQDGANVQANIKMLKTK